MTRLQVQGMKCGHCVASVKQALEGVPGVRSVSVDLDSGSATVEGDADPAALVAAVTQAGYQAAPAD